MLRFISSNVLPVAIMSAGDDFFLTCSSSGNVSSQLMGVFDWMDAQFLNTQKAYKLTYSASDGI